MFPSVDPALISLFVALPMATLGGVWLWFRHRRQQVRPVLVSIPAAPRSLLPTAATADPRLLSKLRGESNDPMTCPACRRESPAEFRHCRYDASPLIPQDQAQDLGGGMFCPSCRRGFEAGVRACPNDGEELLPYPLFRATHPEPDDEDDVRKICPLCTYKYQGAASFCGRDGAELVLMN